MRKINNVREALVETTHKRGKQSIGTCILFCAHRIHIQQIWQESIEVAWRIYKMMQEKRRKERL